MDALLERRSRDPVKGFSGHAAVQGLRPRGVRANVPRDGVVRRIRAFFAATIEKAAVGSTHGRIQTAAYVGVASAVR